MSESDGSTEIEYVRSTYSKPTNCVEAGKDPARGHIAVRNSRDLAAAPLLFTPNEWAAFVAGVKDGQFDADRLPG